ncbi:hypothetical protein EDB86DRAFT_2868330 [Lactarius hatsudake]|nr:hypothetical protein EDB86DRAFT_2868330 [Lactarius hatsudake]
MRKLKGTVCRLNRNDHARQSSSGVNIFSFQKHITSRELTADGLKALGSVATTHAECDGLQAHADNTVSGFDTVFDYRGQRSCHSRIPLEEKTIALVITQCMHKYYSSSFVRSSARSVTFREAESGKLASGFVGYQ